MIIGVDAGPLSITDNRLKVGVYRVTIEALKALLRTDRENEYRLYSFAPGIGELAELREIGGERIREVRLPAMGWSAVWLPLELAKHPVDVFLGFAQSLPHSTKSYNIGFVYDLGFLHQPDAYGNSAKTLKIQTDNLIRKAHRIITISRTTKSDILMRYGNQDVVPRTSPPTEASDGHSMPVMTTIARRIVVAYPGVDGRFSPAADPYRAARPYFLFVGSLTKTKNIQTLLAAFALFSKNNERDSGSPHPSAGQAPVGMTDTEELYDLYLVGGDYWPDRTIDETIEKLRIGDRVKRLGVVPDEDLPAYYRGATAFVTCALGEGFCLPAAEAMACGTPVVALDRGALGEVTGRGGIILRQKEKGKRQTFEFANAIRKMTNPKTRASFSKRAIEQGKKFRWDTFARHVLPVIPS